MDEQGPRPRNEETPMKRTLNTVLVMVAMTVLTASLALAGTATPRVERREGRQQVRVAQGVKSGTLTPRETARLERGQAHVERVEVRTKSDGVVTPEERARLQHAQNVQSRDIRRLKHNDRTR
jgi:hypothetical protein